MAAARMRTPRALLLLVASSLLGGTAGAAGFDLPILGPVAAGRGGAVTAGTADLTAVDANPALLFRVEGTDTLVVWGPIFNQLRYRRLPLYDWTWASSTQAPPTVQYPQIGNQTGAFPLGNLFVGAASDFGLADWTFAVAAYGPAAEGNNNFPADGPQRYMIVQREVMAAFYSFSAAWQPRADLALGLSLQYVDVSLLRIQEVADANNQSSTIFPDTSPYDVLVEYEGADRFGYTATAGVWYRPRPFLELAAAGRLLSIPIDSEGTIKLTGQGDIVRGRTLTTYRRQGDELVPDDRAGLDLDYAPSARLGVRYLHGGQPRPRFDVELDLAWEGWSVMQAYHFRTPDVARVEDLKIDVALTDLDVIRDWQDTWSVRLGGDVTLIPGRLEGRLGGFYESAAVPLSRTFLDFFSFDRLGLGGGLSLSLLDGGAQLDLSYVHVFNEPRAVSEAEGEMLQQRPGAHCDPATGAGCDPHYPGRSGAVINAGTYLSGWDLLTLGLTLHWSRLLGQDPPAATTGAQ
ncbi:MAG: outer membrane protein transport protein [Myxococcota bacterium]|jgi:long-subunit fatty acid transport protein|nr:outer membrane protein transport protein [Myxococcota bacterium]